MNVTLETSADGLPSLVISARYCSEDDYRQLKMLHDRLQAAKVKAAEKGLAGPWPNACGSISNPYREIESISVSLLLGVHSSDLGFVKEGISKIPKDSNEN